MKKVMGIVIKIIVSISDIFKPILKKIVSIQLLRKVKGRLINKSYKSLEGRERCDFVRSKNPDGINLIGNIRAEIGLGQSCRLLANELEASKLEFMIYNYEQISNIRLEDHSWDKKIEPKMKYNINIIHINPYEMGLAFIKISPKSWEYRYNIAFWLWELEVFPEEWKVCLQYVDEIWTPSEFSSQSIRRVTDKPVLTIPYYVTAPTQECYTRDYFGLPKEKFLYLTMYDSNSTMERKNPMGAIEAFKKAFIKEDANVGLVIKINNPQEEDISIIKEALRGYENVYLLTNKFGKVEVNSLIKEVDAFISLHRAEGFGLVLAEAMILGTPTIATNWSSNTEFMTKETACMVGYKMVKINKTVGAYKEGNVWAEPNIDEAAEFIVRLYKDKDFYNAISRKAKKYCEENLSMQKAVKSIEDRVNKIYCESKN